MRWALGGFVLLTVVLIGIRALLTWRRTGRNPLIVLRDPEQSRDALLLLAYGLWLVIVLRYAVEGPFGPWVIKGPIYWYAHYLGLALIVAAGATFVAAVLQLGLSWRIGIDREHTEALVMSGIYGRVRHPIYTALQTGAVGIFLMAPNVFFLVSAILIAAGMTRQALREEAFLLGRFGAVYRDYVIGTGRFLPRLRRKGLPS